MGVRRIVVLVAILLSLLAVIACESGKQEQTAAEKPAAAAKPQPKEPTFSTGEEAFNRIMVLAKSWAPDATPTGLQSELTSETTGTDGKATVWRGSFASAIKQSVKTFVWSGSRQPDAPPFGVTAEPGEAPYTAQIAGLSFQPFMIKTDTDKAFQLAQQHGGEALLKANAKQPVTYLLAMDAQKKVPMWYVIYGKSVNEKKGIGVINATTGAYVGGK
jgi:hypothetical protein